MKDKLPGVEAGSKTDGVKIVVYGPDKAEVFSKLSVYGKDGKDKFAFTAQKGKHNSSHFINIKRNGCAPLAERKRVGFMLHIHSIYNLSFVPFSFPLPLMNCFFERRWKLPILHGDYDLQVRF